MNVSLSGPLTRYRNLVEQGKLQHDPDQERVALELDNLLGRLEQYEKEMEEYHVTLAKWENQRENERRRLLMEEAELKQQGDIGTTVSKYRNRLVERWMFRKKPDNVEPGVGKWVSYLNREKKLDTVIGRRPTPPPAPKGKTMLMDMFYSATEGIVKHRRRFHFHEEMHQAILILEGPGPTKYLTLVGESEKERGGNERWGQSVMFMRMPLRFCACMSTHANVFSVECVFGCAHQWEQYAMLEINEHMHKVWKNQVEEKSLQSNISSWIMNLPFDTKVKEWLAAEERYKHEVQMKNILPAVADKFLVDREMDQRGASILCFDEIQTVDVFAVVALSGIISRLLSTGTVLVATSNRAPNDLNQDGMQKEIFLKLVAKLERHCENVLIGNEIDYRRLIAQRSINKAHYFWPLDGIAFKKFEEMWHEVINQSGGKVISSTILVMFGRTLEVPESCNGVARFKFDYLCGRPVGAADYIAVAKNYHTVFISDIPVMSMRIRDKARRFITLIDELYNHHCCLFCSAASSIDDLFQGTEEGTLFDLERQVVIILSLCSTPPDWKDFEERWGLGLTSPTGEAGGLSFSSFQFETETEGGKLRRNVLAEGNVGSGGAPAGIISLLSGQEEMFAFRRAVSRLIEMQTPLYLEGVCDLHPYFQIQPQELRDDNARTLQSQTTC
ncbi:AFG1-like ATPase [Vitis vinifera]|uniref:AFG1-like ATPase n=1 Tax=Vitis vinifera TaxID=29760 RepID=A0A438F214_VITVI|nr:AFG1-like ATPase [Vitis vinifera]